MNHIPRVALFADTFHEINGAANVIKLLVKYAQEKSYPLLCVRSGGGETRFWREGSVSILELKRGSFAITMDGELKYDPLFWRYKKMIGERLKEFKPDIIHVTGLNDVSQHGFVFAHYLNVSAVASWHTNMHEYTARRFVKMFRWLPSKVQQKIDKSVENWVLYGMMRLNFLAQTQLAPNDELVEMIRQMTKRPSFLMSRGVDTKRFNPEKRDRKDCDELVLGYVGRLRTEKNVRFLAEVDKNLRNAGIKNYKFVLVGEGSDESWLKSNIKNSHFTGVLHGEDLAKTYANMDLFVFPSRTDAFGNVVLEAMSAGVPAVVMPDNGPKFLIKQNVSGYIANDENDFCRSVVELAKNPQQLNSMSKAARESACEKSWERVFESVYDVYEKTLTFDKKVRA